MEYEENGGKVLVPVPRHESIHKKELQEELSEEPCEAKVWEVPRRWRI